jgi:hypothetical protein
MLVRRTRMNVIYVYHLFSALSVFSLRNFKFKFKKHFLNLEIINRGRQVTKTASIKTLMQAGAFSEPPRLKS